ncbi:MAG: CPBP family intramembrane metalloprotease [Clostridia bacterium]|nr:CPBP family intramembrane metalloprotease [Clostridia bacterium]
MQGEGFILPDKDRAPSVFGALVLLFIAFIGLEGSSVILMLLARAVALGGGSLNESALDFLASLIYYTLFIAVPVLVYYNKRPAIAVNMRIKPLSGKIALLCALAAIPGAFFVQSVNNLWCMLIEALGGRIVSPELVLPDTPAGMAGLILSTAALPALCEEMLLRGVLLGAYEERGSLKALFIVSVWFMCLHASVSGMPAEFLGGVMLAYLVITTGSVFAGIIYHTVHNSVILVMLYAARRLEQLIQTQPPEAQAQLAAETDGTVGVFPMLVMAAVTGLILYFFIRRIRQSRQTDTFGVEASPERERSAYEIVVLICCVLCALALYAANVLETVGLIK